MTSDETLISGSLTIRQLEAFAMASRSATFSEASKRLGISQPALSNTIAKLEQLLGLSLFDRTTRSMTLTKEGERLAVVAQNLVRDFRASLESIHDTARKRHGRLSLVVLPSVAASIAPPALRDFFKEYPDFDVSIHDTWQDKGIAWISERVVDFGLLANFTATSDLVFESVYQDDFRVICKRDSPFSARSSLAWKDLTSVPVILTGSGRIRRDVESAWVRAKVTVKPRFEVEQIMSGLALVSAGLGVTILPSLYLPKVKNEKLISVHIDNSSLSREIGVIRRSDRTLPTPAKHLIECFKVQCEAFASEHGLRGVSRSSKGK